MFSCMFIVCKGATLLHFESMANLLGEIKFYSILLIETFKMKVREGGTTAATALNYLLIFLGVISYMYSR